MRDLSSRIMIESGKRGARKVLRLVRRRSRRDLFWWKGPPYNAGDWVGPFLFQAITTKDPFTMNRAAARYPQSSLPLAVSLHGLIFAHCYGIPAAQVESTALPVGDGVKFLDYYAAGGIQSLHKPLTMDHKFAILELIEPTL